MRTIVMSGAVALALVLGGAIPAAAAPETGEPQATVISTLALGSRISCGSATACLAVGSAVNSAGNSAPMAEALSGRKWKSVPVRSPKGAIAAALTDVSCKGARYCLAVGDYVTNAAGQFPYAQTWNGTVLTAIAQPPVPKGGLSMLSAVSCVGVKSCVVTGTSFTGSGIPRAEVFTDTWNGRAWKEVITAAPAGAFLYGFTSLHCFSVAACAAAGYAISGKGISTVLAAAWNGKTWTPEKAVTPAGPAGQEVEVNDLSCASAKSCALVGLSGGATGTTGSALLEVWNGKTWDEVTWAGAKGDNDTAMLGVSCVSASDCIAVGEAGTSDSGAAAALSWNGKTWRALTVPGPAPGDSSDLEGVSCPKAGDCVAIGEVGPSSGTTTSPLAGQWNGKAWQLAPA